MEGAIPPNLRRPRTQRQRMREGHAPPYPSFVVRFKPTTERVVMAYFGLQYAGTAVPAAGRRALSWIAEAFSVASGPGYWDRAESHDPSGWTNILTIAYWDSPAMYDEWLARHGQRWTRGELADPAIGTFTEVVRPAIERFETLFSSEAAEGVAHLAEGWSGEVQEHAYWGGARERIPLSQTDALEPGGKPLVETDGLLRRVIPHQNICLIRSGQDWTRTEANERRMYLEELEPVLRSGMEFLRDGGLSVGCFANRYLSVVDRQGRSTQKTFGMSWWRSLAALERWAESHPTHLAIFGAAMRHLNRLGSSAKLRLYHEVTVAATHEQHFEYFNCHSDSGMLRAGQLQW